MPPTVPESLAWLRRTVAWSNSPDAWRERLGLVFWLGGALLWWHWFASGGHVLGPQHLAVAAGLVLALAFLARRGWLRLFGPVLFYEVLRNARRGRYFLLRWLYAVGLLLLLLWVHWIWTLDYQYGANRRPLDFQAHARLAEMYFVAFAVTQFVVVVALTPAYVAGAVAEEKERKTLEFLLATDLHNREIVFGKFVARLGNLGLFLLTGLPVLSLMQFFGGIDPGLLLASFAVTALTALSLAGLGVLNSVLRRRARDAIVITYLAAVGYVGLASLSLLLPTLIAGYRGTVTKQAFPYVWEPAVERAVQLANAGNPFKGAFDVALTIQTGGPLADTLADVLQRYAVFHGLVAAGCVTWAVLRLRRIALAQAAAPVRSRRKGVLARRRPPVGERPMLWKEVRVEGGLRFGWLGRILVGLLVGVSFIPVVVIFYFMFFDAQNNLVYRINGWQEFGQSVNYWLRPVNAIISMLMLLGVAVRAAGSVSGERDRDTLVSLMGTPLSTQEILWGKWAGSLLSVRLFAVWLAAVWAVGLVTGAVSPPAVILEALAWLAPAAFMAAVGLYFSATSKTTLRATTWTLLTAVFAAGGHWLVMGMCCYLPLGLLMRSGQDMRYALYLEGAMSPPFVFGWLPYRELDHLKLDADNLFPGFVVLGLFLWCVAAAAVGYLAHERFRELTHRHEWVRRPAQPALDTAASPRSNT
jgi:ABC-type transport system involved in multi-copper enzyme maturation permease subunit